MPGNSGLIAEGIIQFLIVVIIVATIRRRGINRHLVILGSFFLLFGTLTLFLALSEQIQNRLGVSLSYSLLDFLNHEAIYFGIAGYLIFQLMMIYDPRAVRRTIFGIASVAVSLTVIHSYHLPFVHLSEKLKNYFSVLSYWTDLAFFAAAIIAVTGILLFLFNHLKGNKKDFVLNYVTTTCTGVSVVISALLILKTLNPFIGGSAADFIIFISYGLAIAGFVIQISLISLPGIVYNSQTRQPVPLATIRIIEKSKNKIIESKVTGQNGRYETLLDAGVYAITVAADGYGFPAKNVLGYRGQEIKIKKPTLICLDIPLEPINPK
ncbi:MAG: carboxypeptidase-like regulatory domain-containing protein [Patescibacteria group bacterium]